VNGRSERIDVQLESEWSEQAGVHVATPDSDLLKNLRASVAAQKGATKSSPKRESVPAKRDVKDATKTKGRSRL
jgi:hypothetical protein